MTYEKLVKGVSLLLLAVLLQPLFLGCVHACGMDDDSHFSDVKGLDITGSAGRSFVENIGQWDESISLVSETDFGHVLLGRSSMSFDLIEHRDNGSVRGSVISYDMIGSNDVAPMGIDQRSGTHNYFLGKEPSEWVSGARSFNGARYDGIWDGIDLRYYLTEEGAKYEFHLEPFTDPSAIRIGVDGHRSMRVEGGVLNIEIDQDRIFYERGLRAFYEDDPSSVIDVEFKVIFQHRQYTGTA